MANSPLLIGLHLSSHTLRAALVDPSGEILERREAEVSPENTVEEAARMTRDLTKRSEGTVSALGFAIPGLVNSQTVVVIVSPDLPSALRERLHSESMAATGLRVEIENDANAAAYGEFKV